MDPVTVMLVIGAVDAVAQAGKGYMQYQSAGAREAALKQQMSQNDLEYQQKTIANYDEMQRIMAAQQAEMSARGVSMDSPSFKAISGETFNIGTKRQRNIELDKRITESNIKLERENVKNTLYAQLFGDTGQLGKDVFELYSKVPTNKGK